MLLFCVIVSVIVVVTILAIYFVKGAKEESNKSRSEAPDYRCNAHYIWDKPDNYGRTDRDSHYAEGRAYKIDEEIL